MKTKQEIRVVDCAQGSDKWFAERLGKVTSSQFSVVLCSGSGRKTYMMKLIAEQLTGITQDGYSNAVMERGIEVEPQAKIYYEQLNQCKVKQVGFISKDDIGCSPDGLVGEGGLVEIKCPNTTTHIETILNAKMPTKYIPQVQGQIWITDRMWCDFISFDPRLKQHPFFCIRIFRDERYIILLSAAVEQFVKELKAITKKIKGE